MMRITLLTMLLALQGIEKPDPTQAKAKYGPHERNVMDLWCPPGGGPFPVILYLHGGAFTKGSRDQVSGTVVYRGNDLGMAVASIDYRYCTQAPYPAPMHDAARAVQFLRSKAKEWKLDPTRIAAFGEGAGGGMALWLALHDDLADPKSKDPVARESSRVKMSLAFSAQCSYDPQWLKEHYGGKAHEDPALAQFVGVRPEEIGSPKARKLFEDASPIHHVSKDDAEVFLVYGGFGRGPQGASVATELRDPKFGDLLKTEMDKVGISCQIRTDRGGGDAGRDWLLKSLPQ